MAEHKTGNDVDFTDGRGPKSKDTPDHYPSDWHAQADAEAKVQNYLGLQHRLLELQGMPSASQEQLDAASRDVEEARALLPKGEGKTASKRPKKARETR